VVAQVVFEINVSVISKLGFRIYLGFGNWDLEFLEIDAKLYVS
jgi:hypothetical protein